MKGSVYLLLTSAIWGFALVAQKEGMSYLDAFSFTALRCLLGGLSLLPLVLWRNRQTGQSSDADSKKNLNENADGISDVNQNQNADRIPDVNSACCKKTNARCGGISRFGAIRAARSAFLRRFSTASPSGASA